MSEKGNHKERKSDTVRRLVAGGDFKGALAIAKGFRLGIRKADWKQMTRAYECMVYPDFYKSIGFQTEDEIDKGIAIIKKLYEEK